ncbi:MAG: hypothetical protein ACRD1R_03570 [Acidobacteriota bacterium]
MRHYTSVTGGRTHGGIFAFAAGQVRPLVLAEQEAPREAGGTFAGFSTPLVNDLGAVAFWGRVEGSPRDEVLYLLREGNH